MIWRGSTQLGIGIAFSSDRQTAKVVANYAPAGNVIGSFGANVPAVCSNTTSTPSVPSSTNPTSTASTLRTTTAVPQSSSTTISPAVVTDFQREALLQHNFRRQFHCVPPLVSNRTMNTVAQNHANYLATNNLFVHSGNTLLGENLWSVSVSGAIDYVNGKERQISRHVATYSNRFHTDGSLVQRDHDVQLRGFEHVLSDSRFHSIDLASDEPTGYCHRHEQRSTNGESRR